MKTVMSIAGSDCIGGAGIQADIKTCCAFKVYATTAITAVVAENTRGVFGIEAVKASFVYDQIKAITDDVWPDAVKIGMLGNADIAREVARAIRDFKLTNVVLDPVLVASVGDSLSGDKEDTVKVILSELAPLATLITPNMPEMAELLGMPLDYEDPQTFPLRLMGMTRCSGVLLKGGHGNGQESVDYLIWHDAEGKLESREFSAPRVETPNSHGTGCTLSTAIACGLAQGLALPAAVEKAKAFVTEALKGGRDLKLGKGSGPLDFFVNA